MTMKKTVPVLPAQNIAATIAFYSENLGFQARHQEEEYGIILQDDIEIHFWQCDSVELAENSSCRIYVEGLDAFHAQVAQTLIHDNAPIEDKPYGLREFVIVDNNGNLVWFFEPIKNI